MWQLDWASKPTDMIQPLTPQPDRYPHTDEPPAISSVGGLMWEEHCHECAAPDCYQTCPLFVRRHDGKCARLEYGVYPNRSFSGLFPFGADVRFRRWGKLETPIPVGHLAPKTASKAARLDRTLAKQARHLDDVRGNPVRKRATSAYSLARLNSLRLRPSADFDEFLIEAWSPEEREFRLAVECKRDGAPYFRESVTIRPGWNRVVLPAGALLAGASGRETRLAVYPEADATVRVVFTWLDFVRYEPVLAAPSVEKRDHAEGSRRPAGKVKCVVWDLDGTLWDGILADLGPDALTPTAAARELIEQLDARGILQSVASKNNHDEAWGVISRLELDQMFLYPSIHWGPKSESIRGIAKSLNIGLDSIAFIDDSEVERAQVADALPEVRIYGIEDLPSLVTFDEFDVQPSDEGRRRRLSYLSEMERQSSFAATSTTSIDDFLKSCAITVDLFAPTETSALQRCHELLQRSNQLNLSTRRYSYDELESLVAEAGVATIAVSVEDRFGDYGLVGFCSVGIDEKQNVAVRDLVLSCRVAKKGIENAVLEAIRSVVAEQASQIRMHFIPTARNAPLLEALQSTGAGTSAHGKDGTLLLDLDTSKSVLGSDIVRKVELDQAVADRLAQLSATRSAAPASATPAAG